MERGRERERDGDRTVDVQRALNCQAHGRETRSDSSALTCLGYLVSPWGSCDSATEVVSSTKQDVPSRDDIFIVSADSAAVQYLAYLQQLSYCHSNIFKARGSMFRRVHGGDAHCRT